MKTGYDLRQGAQILAERRAENERREKTRQAQIRAGYARYLGKRYAVRGRMMLLLAVVLGAALWVLLIVLAMALWVGIA